MKKLLTASLILGVLGLGTSPSYATTTQTILTQSDAQKLIAAAEEKARTLKANVCVAVLDQSGLLLSFQRMDNAPPGCIDAAIAKGRAAALFRTSTNSVMERANGAEPAIATLPGMVPLGGGSPVSDHGTVIGAVGASGSTAANEAAISQSGADSFR